MKIRILASASRDLVDGFRFYEKQAAGVGEYFIDSLYADIDSLLVNTGLGRLKLSCHCERSEAIP